MVDGVKRIFLFKGGRFAIVDLHIFSVEFSFNRVFIFMMDKIGLTDKST